MLTLDNLVEETNQIICIKCWLKGTHLIQYAAQSLNENIQSKGLTM